MIIYDSDEKKVLSRGRWTNEADLDDFLLKHPEVLSELLSEGEHDNAVIPLAGATVGGQLAVAAETQMRWLDALFLYDDSENPPHLVLCEDKKGSNAELRSRAALGQILQYGACLAEMPPADFTAAITQRLKSPQWLELRDELATRGIEYQLGTDEMVAQAAVALEKKRLILAICSDDIPRSLALTVRWLGERLDDLRDGSLRLDALQIARVDAEPEAGVADERVILAGSLAAMSSGSGPEVQQLDEELARTAKLLLEGEIRMGHLAVAPVGQLVQAEGSLSSRVSAPSYRTAAAEKLSGVEEWLEKVAEAPAKKAFHHLNEGLPSEIVSWRPGTRALVLDLTPEPDVSVDLIRLFERSLYFVGDKTLYRLGGEEVARWFRGEVLRRFPIAKPEAKQPAIRDDALSTLVDERGEELVAFIREVGERLSQALHCED